MRLRLQEALDHYNEQHPEALLNQASLAERVGTTQSLVNKHIKGRVMPGPRMLRRYSDVLGCTIDELLLDAPTVRGAA